MKAKVNKDVCIGCGACTAVAMDFFEIGNDGLAEVVGADELENAAKEITEDVKTDVLDAADGCPVGAIEIIEE